MLKKSVVFQILICSILASPAFAVYNFDDKIFVVEGHTYNPSATKLITRNLEQLKQELVDRFVVAMNSNVDLESERLHFFGIFLDEAIAARALAPADRIRALRILEEKEQLSSGIIYSLALNASQATQQGTTEFDATLYATEATTSATSSNSSSAAAPTAATTPAASTPAPESAPAPAPASAEQAQASEPAQPTVEQLIAEILHLDGLDKPDSNAARVESRTNQLRRMSLEQLVSLSARLKTLAK